MRPKVEKERERIFNENAYCSSHFPLLNQSFNRKTKVLKKLKLKLSIL